MAGLTSARLGTMAEDLRAVVDSFASQASDLGAMRTDACGFLDAADDGWQGPRATTTLSAPRDYLDRFGPVLDSVDAARVAVSALATAADEGAAELAVHERTLADNGSRWAFLGPDDDPQPLMDSDRRARAGLVAAEEAWELSCATAVTSLAPSMEAW